MSDFLLELRSEEIPARMQAKAREDLAKLFVAELAKAGITASDITTYATPRRLALIARGLPLQTAAVSEETKGPKTGAPPQALEGFLRKTGLTQDQLVERDGVYFAVIDKPGRATADVLAEAIPAIIRAFPWPKSMRWGAASLSTESLRWVRPLQGIVALLDGVTVPCEVAGIASGRDTLGHRFMSHGTIPIDSAATYVEQLRDAHVIVDQDERANIIALGAKMAARKAGLTLIEDAGLLAENAGLTEWPVPLLGRFDEAFLSVPPEVIQLTARVNQKYFVCNDADGKLANAFICTANIDAEDGGARIVEGNRKVLAARLSDARFFFETDLKVPLAEQAKKLDRIVFHEKLGTVADKVERVAKLARWLCEEGIVGSASAPPTPFVPSEVEGRAASESRGVSTSLDTNGSGVSQGELANLAERAARLCKADLVTGMVGEFPELQGLMGGYYAAAQGKALGEDPRVAAAIRDHYKPVGQGDDVPTDPVTVAVSLADKLDTLFCFFALDEEPTGSRDPFALRRAALAVLNLLANNHLRLPLRHAMRLLFGLIGPLLDRRRKDLEDVILPNLVRKISGPDDLIGIREDKPWAPYIVEVRSAGDLKEHRVTQSDLIIAYWSPLRLRAFAENRGQSLLDFFADRLKVQQREAGVRHDLIDAVFALGGEDDLVRLLARVRALQAFIGTEDGANLLAGYKRAANILKKEGGVPAPSPHRGEGRGEGAPQAASLGATPSPNQFRDDRAPHGRGSSGGRSDPELPNGERALGYTPEPAEAALIAALDIAAPAAAAAVAAEDFEAAMAALATLRAPIDAFFESVTVNDPDPDKRAARLSLLEKVRDAVLRVADFSEIVG
ncbi:MAG: glycine--tRNA ligase subunit beta [Sphingomonas sp.]|nr:glycine--tRNA ligase subunit beta [Sphingomonas sp.]